MSKKAISFLMILALVCCNFGGSLLIGNAQSGSLQMGFNSAEMFSTSQGAIWKYRTREAVSNAYVDMTYDSANGRWTSGSDLALIWPAGAHTSSSVSGTHEIQTALCFIAPYTGSITINMAGGIIQPSSGSSNGVCYMSFLNNTLLVSNTNILPGEAYQFAPMSLNVTKGDQISFLLSAIGGNNGGDSTTINPIVLYTSREYVMPVYNAKTMFSGTQGVWKYQTREAFTNVMTDMNYDASQPWWISGPDFGLIFATGMYPSNHSGATYETQTALSFVAPYTGNIKINVENGTVTTNADSANGVYFCVLYNNASWLLETTIIAPDSTYQFAEQVMHVTQGDRISFLLGAIGGNANGDATKVNPIISYTSTELNLYNYNVAQGNFVSKINPATTADAFINSLNPMDASYIELVNSHTLTSNEAIGTGTTANIYYEGALVNSYTVVIFGDVSGDSFIGVSDLIAIKKHLLKTNLLTGASEKAARVSGKSSVSLSDLIAVKKQILGAVTISQNVVL